jgi:outer membrane receptor for ferrienterochelin and colicin
MILRTVVLAGALCAPRLAWGATISGRVLDARTGEPVAKVEIAASGTGQRATSDAMGKFSLDVAPGHLELLVTTVGYGLVKRTVNVAEAGAEIEIALQQDTAVRRDTVTVTSGVFEGRDENPPSQWTLSNREIQALSMVLIGDPLRAAQASPSVTGNNDFRSEFAVRGASYDRVALYIDGVLTDSFAHAANLGSGSTSSSEKLSLSVINSDTVNEVTLLPGAFPARYGGSAAVLNLETREGSYVKTSGRLSTGLLSTAAVMDGPLAQHKGSWLLAARSSYADYLQRFVERITGTGRSAADRDQDPESELNFSDAQAKGSYTFSPRSQVGVSAIYGIFTASQALTPGTVDVEAVKRVRDRNLLATAYWRYTPGAHLWIEARGFTVGDGARNQNRNDALLDNTLREQSGFRIDVTGASGAQTWEGGVYVRFLRFRRQANGYTAARPTAAEILEDVNQRAAEDSYWVQDTWKRKHVSITVGGRAAHSDLTGETLGMPRAALSYSPSEAWTIRGGAGLYGQFPQMTQVFGFFGNRALRAERSGHFDASLERRMGLRMRILAKFYEREDRRMPFSFSEPLLVGGHPTILGLPFRNTVQGHARGGEFTLQRRSANGLMGWMSYGYSRTAYRDATDGLQFPSDFDQRHAVTAFGSYRLRPTLEFSSQWRYGTGTPVPGFWKIDNGALRLSTDRNQLRAPNYARLDVRANKAFLFAKWKLTVSAEILNLLNRKNQIAVATDLLRVYSSGRLSAGLEESFRILPSVAITISF